MSYLNAQIFLILLQVENMCMHVRVCVFDCVCILTVQPLPRNISSRLVPNEVLVYHQIVHHVFCLGHQESQLGIIWGNISSNIFYLAEIKTFFVFIPFLDC